MSRSSMLWVDYDHALAWADGKIADSDLILNAMQNSPFDGRVIFWALLPNIAAYRSSVSRLLSFWRAGAITLIARTGNPIVEKALLRRGAVVSAIEVEEKKRFLFPKEKFDEWMRRCDNFKN